MLWEVSLPLGQAATGLSWLSCRCVELKKLGESNWTESISKIAPEKVPELSPSSYTKYYTVERTENLFYHILNNHQFILSIEENVTWR